MLFDESKRHQRESFEDAPKIALAYSVLGILNALPFLLTRFHDRPHIVVIGVLAVFAVMATTAYSLKALARVFGDTLTFWVYAFGAVLIVFAIITYSNSWEQVLTFYGLGS